MNSNDVGTALRVLHKLVVLGRALRGDKDIDTDHQQETARARKIKRSMNDVARHAVGCRAPADCDCAVCAEEGAS